MDSLDLLIKGSRVSALSAHTNREGSQSSRSSGGKFGQAKRSSEGQWGHGDDVTLQTWNIKKWPVGGRAQKGASHGGDLYGFKRTARWWFKNKRT